MFRNRVFHNLYGRLALGLVVVLLVVGLSYAGFAAFLADRLSQTAAQRLNRDLARDLVRDNRIVHDGRIDEAAMKETFQRYMMINPGIEIYYLDPAGKILSYSADPGVVLRRSVGLGPIRAFLGGDPMFPLLGDDPRAYGRNKPFSVTPIPDRSDPQGYLYVVLQGEEYAAAREAETQGYMLALGGAVLAGSLLLGLLMGMFIFYRLTLRLERLQAKVGAFAASDFRRTELFPDPTSPAHGATDGQARGDEVMELEAHIARMSHHIARQWAALQQQDRLRREMIGSISHDLRTPLAAVQGYLETIVLKGDRLPKADQARYLDIILRQTRRLQKLIDQLFEFVKLEARDTQPSFEAFSILELVYDVVGKFALQAERRGVRLGVDEQARDVQVMADIGLIERVLDNLLGNALQYTPRGGRVWVQVGLQGEGEQVRVAVNDNGPGIPAPQQVLVFQRFYRADNPERSAGGHAGLGLAIVKRIIELHRQQVWLESEAGGGASFVFTLASSG